MRRFTLVLLTRLWRPGEWGIWGGRKGILFWASVSSLGRRKYRAYSAPSSRSGDPVEGVSRVDKRASLRAFAFPSLNSSTCVMGVRSKSSPQACAEQSRALTPSRCWIQVAAEEWERASSRGNHTEPVHAHTDPRSSPGSPPRVPAVALGQAQASRPPTREQLRWLSAPWDLAGGPAPSRSAPPLYAPSLQKWLDLALPGVR